MAWRAGDGFVDFTADDSKLRRVGARVQATLKRVQQRMERVSRVARNMFLAGGAMAAVMVRTSASFEQAMARVRALTSATEEEFSRLQKTALELGRTTVFSARQAAEAMGYFALAGFKTDKIIAAMPHALNLAAAGQLDVAQAADIVAKIMAGMGLEANELKHAVDVLAKGFTSANTDLMQLGEAMKYVGPVGKATGKSLEEITAALMIMSNAGIQASMAGTSLRGALTRLAGGVPRATKVFAKLGVTTKDMQGRMRPLADVVDDLRAKLANLGEAERMGLIMQAFGQRAGPAMAELLSRGGEELRRYQELLEGSAGTAERIAKVQLDTLQGKLTLVKSAMEGVAIAIGTALHPMIESMAGRLQRLAGLIGQLRKQQIERIIATAKTVGKVLLAAFVAPKLLAGLRGLIALMRGLRNILISLKIVSLGAAIAISTTLTAALITAGGAFAYLAYKGARLRAEMLGLEALSKQYAEIHADLRKVEREYEEAKTPEKRLEALEKMGVQYEALIKFAQDERKEGEKRDRAAIERQRKLIRSWLPLAEGDEKVRKSIAKWKDELAAYIEARPEASQYEKQVKHWQKLLGEVKEKIAEIRKSLEQEMPPLGAVTEPLLDAEAERKKKKALETATARITELLGQLRVLQGAMTEEELEIFHLRNLGITEDKLRIIRGLLLNINATKKKIERGEELKGFAERVKESLKTAVDHFKEFRNELDKILAAGLITRVEYLQAAQQRMKELMPGAPKKPEAAQAQRVGMKEYWWRLAQAGMGGRGTAEERTAKTGEKSLRVEEKQLKVQQRLERELQQTREAILNQGPRLAVVGPP